MGSEAMERLEASCDGIGESAEAPESWEMVDLEASMKKLLDSSPVLGYQQVERGQAAPHLNSRAQISSFVLSATSAAGRSEAFPQLIDSDDIDSFLLEALQGKDRLTILRLEQEVEKFMRNLKLQQLEFQPMPSSYLRLVAHRVVQHYNLQSSVADSSTPDGARIVARKTSDTRFPRVRLADIPISTYSEEKQAFSTQQRFELKRRPNKSTKHGREVNGLAESSSKLNPSKTVEERKEEYNRARARIFNGSDLGGKVDDEASACEISSLAFDSCLNSSFRFDTRMDPSSDLFVRGDLPNVASRTGNVKQERETTALLQKGNGRVAVFRDREKDRKDPDYDRNYDRYMQRFDPGFGVSQAPPFGVQAMYSPVVNYNTEFPHLGGPAHPQVQVDAPVSRARPPQLRGPWASSSNAAMTYGHPDSMLGPFNPGHLGSQPAGLYIHPQQYPQPGPPMTYVHSQERFSQSISQPHSQTEGSFSQARHQ